MALMVWLGHKTLNQIKIHTSVSSSSSERNNNNKKKEKKHTKKMYKTATKSYSEEVIQYKFYYSIFINPCHAE